MCKQTPNAFQVEVEVQPSTGTRLIVFDKAVLSFLVDCAVDVDTLVESFPIGYRTAKFKS